MKPSTGDYVEANLFDFDGRRDLESEPYSNPLRRSRGILVVMRDSGAIRYMVLREDVDTGYDFIEPETIDVLTRGVVDPREVDLVRLYGEDSADFGVHVRAGNRWIPR